MTKQQFQQLLDKYLLGNATDEEIELLERFYNYFQKNEGGWELIAEKRKEILRKEIFQSIQKNKDEKAPSKTYFIGNKIGRKYLKWAASIILFIGIAGILSYYLHLPTESEIQYITKSTLVGQTATFKLGDGSTIKLNSSSMIRYRKDFREVAEELTLQGEAFFEVKKDPDKPFIVKAGGIKTIVLGTSFNINASDSLSVKVALVTGKVMVGMTDKNEDSNVILKPGDQVLYERNKGEMTLERYDPKSILSWKDGIIYLKEANHKEVFERLANWYAVDFEFENTPGNSWHYSGEFKGMSLELILQTIGYTEGFDYKIRDKKIIIKFTK